MTTATSSQRTSPRRGVLLLLAVCLLAVIGCEPTSSTAGSYQEAMAEEAPGSAADGWTGRIPDDPQPVPELVMEDQRGETFDLQAETAGDPLLLFFGYTHCPDICPVHLAGIANALDDAGVSADAIDVVFVSVDPERDDQERVRTFLDHFSSSFVGLTGDMDAATDAIDQLGLPQPVIEDHPGDDSDYLVGHPAQVLAFDAEGNQIMQYPFGTRQSDWVDDLPRLAAGEIPEEN